MMKFEDLELIEPIRRALQDEGYITPTPIQQQAIPIILDGIDLLGCAQTGTGKTAAFSIPIIQRLHLSGGLGRKSGIKALVLTPTRELAIQIDDSFRAYGAHTSLRSCVIFGGVKQKQQTDTLARGVDILVATPGRLQDLINQGFISLNHIEYFVLDEADRMLDMGFINDIKRIIPLLPKRRQSLFFSATMPLEIEKLANTILFKPEKVEVTPASSTVDRINQELFYVERNDKIDLIVDYLSSHNYESVLIFTRTKHRADKVARSLTKSGVVSEAIHGDKSQNARQRALTNFKEGRSKVLVATDIAARGIDIDHLSHVINFEMPDTPETYVHRIGRTGRAGREGIAISLCDADEVPMLNDIQKLIGKTIEVTYGEPFSKQRVKEAVGNLKERKLENQKQRTQQAANRRASIAAKQSGSNKPVVKDVSKPSFRKNRQKSNR